MANDVNADAATFSKEERAKISKDFRDEIKQHGLGNAILSLVDTNSSKAAIRKTVLTQQCRKMAFREDFRATCRSLAKSHPSLAFKILELRSEISGI